jgi:trimeric autotransporter adhesin
MQHLLLYIYQKNHHMKKLFVLLSLIVLTISAHAQNTFPATGNVGIGTSSPRGQFDVAGGGDIFLSKNPITGSGQTIYLPGNIYLAPFTDGSDWAFLQARRSDNSGSTNLRIRTYNIGTSVDALSIRSNGLIGLSTTTPTETLDVNGTARIRLIAQDNTLTKLLTTDANGKIFWRDASSLLTLPYINSSSKSLVGVGTGALVANTIGSDNTAFGINALKLNTTGSYNTANGSNALYSNNGVGNTATGYYSLYSNTTGGNNIATGFYALYSNTTGGSNIATGYNALIYNTIGNDNVAIGRSALGLSTSGNNNTSTGNFAIYNNTTGVSNTAAGHSALYTNATGSNNTAIGVNADVTNGSLSYATAIGASAKVSVSYGIVLGTASNFVGIRQNSPTYALHVQNAYCDGNTWFNASDKNLKENFARIKTEESVLTKVMELPIQYWNYKGTAEARHIGPTAQDFYKVFQLGGNERAIASVDEAGVALAAIQELAKKTEKLEALVNIQQELIASLMKSTLEKTATEPPTKNGLSLYQNSPNPFTQETEIKMYIPEGVGKATLYVYDLNGKSVQQLPVQARGQAEVKLSGGALTAGIYLYTLVADDAATEVKKMILTE